MQAIEFETIIDTNGNVHVPERYRTVYGHQARLLVLLADVSGNTAKAIDPMQYSDKVDWPVDGLEYQQEARNEWE
ncbi:hypothetical protein [Candidatus Thiosymbion oneisti]|uniref:hypothetical protein n=1 Tax=Candidatus Thiosymbion oneisti TaxID=589554 RepID=UPI00105DADED|nr:hypothetical protein [Candidatus Thiosymbion oneisti]